MLIQFPDLTQRPVSETIQQYGIADVSKNVLTVDLGNSRAKFGIFEWKNDRVRLVALSAVSLSVHGDIAGQIAVWVQQYSVDACIAAGSNPPILDQLIADWPEQLPVATAIRTARMIPVTLLVDQPDAVGLDRVLNALAAVRLYPHQNVIIVDSGTATTIDLVSMDGSFCGGTILPGLRLSAIALHDYTARLPMIDVDVQNSVSPQLPGKDTESAIRAGVFWGQVGAIREIVDRIGRTCGDHPIVVFTGGGSRLLNSHFERAETVEALALHGLAMLGQ